MVGIMAGDQECLVLIFSQVSPYRRTIQESQILIKKFYGKYNLKLWDIMWVIHLWESNILILLRQNIRLRDESAIFNKDLISRSPCIALFSWV